MSSAEGSSTNSNIPNGSVGTSCLLDAAAAVESCSALTLARNIDSLETSKHRIGQQVVAFSTEMADDGGHGLCALFSRHCRR